MRAFPALLTALLVVVASCSKDHSMEDVVNPRDPSVTRLTPPVPADLSARPGNHRIELNWALDDSAHLDAIRGYRVYRNKLGEAPARSDTMQAPPAKLGSMTNGTPYEFSVATILSNGLEGLRSGTLIATPGVFGVQVNGGRNVTNSASVRLSLVAPDGTRGMQVSNEEDLTAAPVQPFTTELAWNLVPGDGEKTVSVRFVDADGNVSLDLSDSIQLDTRAEILSVFVSAESAQPGDILQFRLDAGEANGTAQVQLGSGGRVLELFDDGANGDVDANDGLYTLFYTVPQDLALVDVLVTGGFTDEAGNQAPALTAPVRLTVLNDPPAVVLDPIVSPAPGKLFLSWSQAPDPNRFSAYRVYRADAPGVDTSRTRTQVRESTSRSATTYTDSDLDPNRTYYYRVYVVDPNGLSSSSNEESARPALIPPPDPVTLEVPAHVTESSVSLSFSRSLSPDFAQYRIYRGEQADLGTDPNRRLLTTVTTVSQTTYEDRTELEQGMTYWYRVDVVDSNGSSSASNSVSALIPDLPPVAVTLNTPTSIGETAILLSWTKSDERDFQRYEVRRSASAGVGPEAQLLTSLDQKETISYLDAGLTENTDYYYRVFVMDNGQHRTGSNEIKVTTQNADPPVVTLAAPTEVAGSPTPTISLSWTRSDAHDFEQYRVYRDTSPAVGEGSTLIRSIAEAATLRFTDEGLADNKRYYYRVFVFDDADKKAGSNEESILTANRPPTPVTLSVAGTTANSINLTWTENANSDFNEYRLLQGTTSTSFPTTVISFAQREQTSHTLFLADSDSTRYFFKVVTFDKALDSSARLSTDSNIVSAKTVRP